MELKVFLLAIAGGLIGGYGSHFLLPVTSSTTPVVSAPARAVEKSRVIEAQDFRLVDAQGKLRAELAMSREGGTALFFFDSKGRNRLNLGVYPAGENDLPFLVLNDVSGEAAGIFRLVGTDQPYLILKSQAQERSIYGLDGENPFLVNYEKGKKSDVFGSH